MIARGLPTLLFVVSGCAALVLEIAWLEALGRIFGSTAKAAATTLAAFFLGLGVGAHLGGRLAPRLAAPLRGYGVAELLVALGAVASLGLVPLEAALFARVAAPVSGVAGDLLRLGLAFAVLAPATIAMGTTWPLLVEAASRRGWEAARAGAILQAANAGGAAVGALLAGFVLPPVLGLRGTLLAAAGAAALAGTVAWVFGRPLAGDPPGPSAAEVGPKGPPAPAGDPNSAGGTARALALFTGFLGFALQVLFVRAFSLAVPASIQVFALVLVVWLLALSVGALLARVLVTVRTAPRGVAAALLAAGALLVVLAVPLFLERTDGLRPPAPDLDWNAYLVGVATTALFVLGPPVLLLGALFPYLLRMAHRERAGPAAGALLAFNTAGAIAGALVAAFLLLPAFGLWASVRGAALAAALVALVLAWGRWRTSALASAAVLVASASFFLPAPVIRLRPGERLLETWEGSAGTVAVVEDDEGQRKLVYDNVFVLGGSHDRRWESLQAHVPLIAHPGPERAFFLGMGTGITAAAALDHPLARIDVAELVGEVVVAARRHFGEFAGGLFEDPRVRVLVDDGRHVLRHATDRYDVIVGDLFFPWQPGTAYLYTREHLQSVRDRLRPGGHFAQWLPCYQLGMEEMKGVLATFVEVFPRVTLWRGDFFVDRPILAVVGHRDADALLDGDALVAGARRLLLGEGADLARDADTIPFHLYAGNLTQARALLSDARLLTDDRPWIQWTAPRSERVHRLEAPPVAVADALLAFETALREAAPAVTDPYLARLDDRRRGYVEAGLALRKMAVHLDAYRLREHAAALRDYVRRVEAAHRPDLSAWIE